MRLFRAVLSGLLLTSSLALASAQEWAHFTPPPMKDEPPVEAANGMAVSAQHYASEVGAQILKDGGNAIDAAVAIGYALAVTYPSAAISAAAASPPSISPTARTPSSTSAKRRPLAASANMYLDAKGNVIPMASLYGYKAVARAGHRDGLPEDAGRIRHHEARAGDGARDQAGRAGLCAAGGRCAPSSRPMRTISRRSPMSRAIFLKNGKPYAAGDTAGAEGPGRDLEGDFGQGSGRLLQGRYRRARGRGVARPMAAFSP